MNRRTFATSIASSLALIGPASVVMAQRKKSVISKLTEAEIDFGDTSFEFDDHRVTITGANQVEHISLKSDYADLHIQFMMWKPRLDPAGQYDALIEQLESNPDTLNIEGLGITSLPDGAWMAYRYEFMDLHVSTYWEVQLDAFADLGVDLWIELRIYDNEVEAALEDTQAVAIAGMPPLLFMEESEIAGGLFVPTEENISSTRLSSSLRGSRSGSTSSTGSGDVVEDVRAHQEQYKNEFDDLISALNVVAEGAVGQEEASAIATIFEVGESWIGYPTIAEGFEFGADLESLKIAYLDWVDAVGVLGTTLLSVLSGNADADDFGTAIDAVNAFDRKLSAELRNLGVFPDSRAMVIDSSAAVAFLSAELRTLGVVIKPVGQVFARPNSNQVIALNTYLPAHSVA